jgi:phage baseplate assembly protein V
MRSNSRAAATGVSVAFSRARFVKADDSKRMQEAQVQVFHDEAHTGIERFQQYGFSSVPLPPDQQQGGKAAEAVIAYLGAHRSHPVVLAVDDRRTRPKNWSAGDVGLWHHKGATHKLTDSGFTYDAGPDKQPHLTKVDKGSVKIEKDRVTLTVNNTKVIVKDGQILLGSENASNAVMTTAGPSSIVFADI